DPAEHLCDERSSHEPGGREVLVVGLRVVDHLRAGDLLATREGDPALRGLARALPLHLGRWLVAGVEVVGRLLAEVAGPAGACVRGPRGARTRLRGARRGGALRPA